jgi:hypothetical protein
MNDLEQRLRDRCGHERIQDSNGRWYCTTCDVAADTLAAIRERVENRLRPGAQDMGRTEVYAFAQELKAVLKGHR